MAYTVAAGVEIVTSLLLLVRVARGPSVTDRLVALNATLKPVATTAFTIVVGAVLAWWYVRRPEPRPMRWLRASQTGSTNDYAAFAVVGFIATAIALLR